MMPSRDGMPVDTLIWMVKNAITESGVSRLSKTKDLRVSSVQITLEVLAAKSGGTEISIRVPFIGTEFGASGTGETDDTEALRSCVAEAQKQGKIVWVPPGKRKTLPVETSRHAFAYVFEGSGTVSGASNPYRVLTEH